MLLEIFLRKTRLDDSLDSRKVKRKTLMVFFRKLNDLILSDTHISFLVQNLVMHVKLDLLKHLFNK